MTKLGFLKAGLLLKSFWVYSIFFLLVLVSIQAFSDLRARYQGRRRPVKVKRVENAQLLRKYLDDGALWIR